MIPKQAIEKAIEGGWKKKGYIDHYTDEIVALDPAFWQALGKALGWKTNKLKSMEKQQPGDVFQHWYQRAMRFYDLILTGGDTEAYWEELLK